MYRSIFLKVEREGFHWNWITYLPTYKQNIYRGQLPRDKFRSVVLAPNIAFVPFFSIYFSLG